MFHTYQKKTNKIGFLKIRLLISVLFILTSVFSLRVYAQPNYIVNSNIDAVAVNLVTGETATPGQITLRSAIQAATAQPGAHIITFSGAVVSPINLTLGQITVGNAAAGNSITINGPGMGLLTVNQTTDNRIFSTGTGAVTFVLTDITLNFTGPGVTPYSGGGGAIIAGGASAATTLTNVTISNFRYQIGNGGAISASSSLAIHSLTISNCIFNNNRCGGGGGAVSYNGLGTATITGCTFNNNHTGLVGANTGGDGGAVATTGGGAGGTYTIEKNTFLNNQVENVTGHAGAIMNSNGALTVRFNRFIGNTCLNVANPPLANIIGQASGTGPNSTVADNNWWGVNTGPGVNDATFLGGGTGSMTVTKWLQLKTTASPSTICNTPAGLGNTTMVTTSFLSNSASEAIAVADLSTLISQPVNWGPTTLGSLSGQQGTIQGTGTATATFTSNGTGGTATVNAQVDNVPAGETSPSRASITVNTLPTVTNPVNTASCIGGTAIFTTTVTGTPGPTITWRIGSTILVNGVQGSGSTVAGQGTNTLTITNVQPGDASVNYNVQAGNTCGTATSADATLTVTPNNTITLTSAAGTNNQTVAVLSPITNITYSTTGATGATFSGLPPGVTGNWAANVVTISGSPSSAAGSPYNYTVTLTGGCGSITATGSITVTLIVNVIVNPGAGGYVTLKAAFDAINAGTHTGALTVDIVGSTTETAPAVLNASGSGAANYTTILVQPSGGAARTVSGAITAGSPLIDMNGADNVTVDGLNSSGNSLTIENTTASPTSGTSTIRFIGGATNNTFTRCSLKGAVSSSVATNGATVFFSTDAVTANGNDNNTISNCDIGPSGANLPTKAILGNGSTTTTAIGNSGIVITNNDIHDYFGAAVTSSGIATNGGCNTWTITNNRFYQTNSKTWTTGALHNAINIGNTTATSGAQGFTITGNIVGYASKTQTGTYSLAGSTGTFRGIVFNGITGGTVSNINSNTVQAIGLTGVTSSGTSSGAPFIGIYVNNGVAITNSNTIGSQSAWTLLFLTTSASAADMMGIFNFSVDAWTANTNNIGGLTVSNAGTGAANAYGIRLNTSGTVTTTLNGNIVGGTIANSIQSTSTATGSQVAGIFVSTSIATVSNNTIRNLTAAGGTGTTTAASVVGIDFISATPVNNAAQNTIFNLTNTNATAATVVTGIQFTGGTGNVVERNNIYALTTATNSATAEVNGIRVAGGTTIYRNNMIAIGAGIANAIDGAASNTATTGINGINEALGTNSFFHNSVYIGGSPTAGVGASYAFNGTQTVSTRSFRDNIFFNARSNAGATGKNYAIKINGTAPNQAGLTINNNVYFANGTGAVFGFFNSLDVANLAAWKIAVGQDAGSFESNPQYNDPTNAIPDLHLHPTNATVAEGNGVDVGVTNDFDGQTRASFTPVDIGADAGNFSGVDLSAPVITYTALSFTCSTADRIFTATITDVSGVPADGSGTEPRVYFKKNAGPYFSTDGNLTSGTVTNGVWTFTISEAAMGGIVPGDVISYYVVAQDVLGNISSNPSGVTSGTVLSHTTPVSPNTYSINNSLSGTYNVGTGEPAPFNTLTSAVNAYNTACLTGAVVFNLVDANYSAGETFPITINANPFASAVNTLTIKPNAAGTLITGSVNGALIKLNDADYVTIDGSSSGASAAACLVGGDASIRDLTIQNTNTGTATVVIAVQSGTNGAQNNTIKNVNVLGQDPTTTLIGIALGGNTPGTIGADNDNNRVENCSVKRAIFGIYSAGASLANQNANTVITQNDLSALTIDRIRRVGIVIFNENNTQISYNSVAVETNESADAIGIGVGTQAVDVSNVAGDGVTNAQVFNNKINGIASLSTVGFSAAGIAVATATGGANVIRNNMITGVTSPATAPDIVAGIYIVGSVGSNTRVYNNSVSMTGDRGTVASQTPSYGIAITGTDPTVELKNNIFYTTQTASGGGVNAKSYAIGMVTTTFVNLNSNNNMFWSTGANDGGFRSGSLTTAAGTDYATLALWQAAVADDANSVETLPPFVNDLNDLHITADNNLGTSIATVTDDYDCQSRDASIPDIGADEIPNCAAVGGTASGSATFCGSGTPGITASGYTASGVTYQWYSSTVLADYPNSGTAISGETNPASLNAGVVSTTTYFWLRVSCPGNTSVANSTLVTVSINNVTAGSIDNAQTICSGSDPAALSSLAPGTGTGVVTYQWQSGTGTCLTASFADIGGATSDTYDPGVLTVTTSYRRVTISTLNGVPCSTISNCVTITVNDVNAGSIDNAQTICSGSDPAALSNVAPGTGSGAVTYQWQSGTGTCLTATFADITGATNDTYDPGVLTVTTSYRRVATSTLNGVPCSATSNCVTVTVNLLPTPLVTAFINDDYTYDEITVCSGSTIQLSTQDVISPDLHISFPVSTNFHTGYATFGPSTLVSPINGNIVYIQDILPSYLGCNPYAPGSLTGKVALIDRGTCNFTVKVLNAQTAGAIGVIVVNNNPGGIVNMGGTNPSITIPSIFISQADGLLIKGWLTSGLVTGNTAAVYSGYLWSTGATTPTISVSPTVTTTYSVTVTDANGCVGTDQMIITVNDVTAGSIDNAQTICSGSDPAALSNVAPGTGSGAVTYQWQSGTGTCLTATFADITGATNDTYDPGLLTVTTSYRRVATSTLNGVSCSATSNCVTVTVNPIPDAVATPIAQTICTGSAITTIVNSGSVANTAFNWTRDNTVSVTGIAASGAGDISGSLTNTTNAAITVTFTITPTANGCTGTAITATVLVAPKPILRETYNGVQVTANNDGTDDVGSFAVCSSTSDNVFLTEITDVAGITPLSNIKVDQVVIKTNVTINTAADGVYPISSIGPIPLGRTATLINPYISGTVQIKRRAFYDVNNNNIIDANECVGDWVAYNITVNPVPDVTATPSSQTICTGNAITTIVNSGNVAGTVYNWTRDNTATVTGIAASGSGNISGSLTNTTAAPVTVTFTITPSYTNAGGTCTGTPVTATVTVNQANYFVCPGNMVETIYDVICFKAVLTPSPVYCGTLTKLTWKLTGATTLSSPTTGINYLGLRNMNVGTTTVTYTATFTGNIVKTCSFTVLVIETIPPNILCPLDKSVNADPGKCDKTGPVSLGTPTTNDNCGVASVTNNAPAVYHIGVNYVTWTVTDKSGNTRTCVQRVTVYDAERPTITCPANVIANTGPVCSATPVTLPPPVFSDNCRVKTLTWAMTGVTWGSSSNMGINYVPTMNYATGVSTITYTVIDAAGNSRTCSFTVTLKDVTPPTIVCPVAQTFCKVANNTYTIPVLVQSDNCGILSTTYAITGATSRTGSGANPSGIFNLGVSTIKWTVKDVAGNTSTCTTVVTILATSDPLCSPPPVVNPLVNPKYTEPVVPVLTVTAWPNPTANYFNVKVSSPVKDDAVEIRMYDMTGKLVQTRRGVQGETYIFGERVTSGMYMIEVNQGSNKQMVKLVKTN